VDDGGAQHEGAGDASHAEVVAEDQDPEDGGGQRHQHCGARGRRAQAPVVEHARQRRRAVPSAATTPRENGCVIRRPLFDDARVGAGAAVAGGPGDPGAELLYLCMEVAGCPTVCRHCWAQGVGYGIMPLADIEWVLDEAHRHCGRRGLAFDAYPMHELAAHPDAARLCGLFNQHSASAGGGTMFEPWPTTGVPLATRGECCGPPPPPAR
jgi:hypothetical protein